MVWSAENAMSAYLKSLETINKNSIEPDVTNFIAALAAGSGAKLMVEACYGPAGTTTLALVSVACQTGGHVVCVLPGYNELQASIDVLGLEGVRHVKFVVGDAGELLTREYSGADFVVIDCRMDCYDRVGNVARDGAMKNCGGFVLEYHLLCREVRKDEVYDLGGFGAQLLPIGGGLRICKAPHEEKRNRWIVCIDEETGEEHAVRIAPAHRRTIKSS